MTEPTYRCGFLIEHSANLLPGRPGVYRVSKDGQSNIIGERFFDDINADSDQAFEEFLTAAIRPDFPHPFMVGDLMADEEPDLCGTYSSYSRWGGTLGPCMRDIEHEGWHLDKGGAAWEPTP